MRGYILATLYAEWFKLRQSYLLKHYHLTVDFRLAKWRWLLNVFLQRTGCLHYAVQLWFEFSFDLSY